MEKEFNYEVAVNYCAYGVKEALLYMSTEFALICMVPSLLMGLVVGILIGSAFSGKNNDCNRL